MYVWKNEDVGQHIYKPDSYLIACILRQFMENWRISRRNLLIEGTWNSKFLHVQCLRIKKTNDVIFYTIYRFLACLEQTHVSQSVHHCSLKILFLSFSRFASHLLSKRDIRLDQFEICLCKYRLFLAYWFICLRPHVYGLWKIFWCAILYLYLW